MSDTRNFYSVLTFFFFVFVRRSTDDNTNMPFYPSRSLCHLFYHRSVNEGMPGKDKASKSQTVRDVKKRERERKSRDALRSDDASESSDTESSRARPEFSTGNHALLYAADPAFAVLYVCYKCCFFRQRRFISVFYLY